VSERAAGLARLAAVLVVLAVLAVLGIVAWRASRVDELCLRVRLVDEEGRAVQAARASLLVTRAETTLVEVAWVGARADGRAELCIRRSELDPAGEFFAAGHAPGYTRVVVRLSPAQCTQAELELGELHLGPGGEVAGRVVAEDGRPLAGAGVVVSRGLGEAGTNSEDVRRLWPPVEPLAGPYLPVALSDELGRFELVGVPSGSFALVVRAAPDGPALLPARVEPLVIVAGERTDVGELVLAAPEPAETISGRVMDEAGEPLAGITLSLGDGGVRHPGGASSRADGSFTLLAPLGGSWIVSARDPRRRWNPVDMKDVVSGARDVLVRLQAAPATPAPPTRSTAAETQGPVVAESAADAEFDGRFKLGGEVPGSWLVEIGGQSTQLDAAGDFRVRALARGPARLSIRSGFGGDVETYLAAACELHAGYNSWEHDLTVATLTLENLPEVGPAGGEPAGADTPEFLLEGVREGLSVRFLFQEHSGPTRTLERVPVGPWKLSRRADGFRFGGEALWVTLVEFSLRPGGTQRVVVP
jgi:hypothetical protein